MIGVDAAAMAGVIAALATDEFYAALRAFINGVVAIDNCVALVFDRNGPPVILHQWSPQQPNYFQMLYSQGAYTLDPFYRASLGEPRHGVLLLRDVAPDGFGESDFYKAYYEKVEMIDEIGLLCAVDDDQTMHLSLGRRKTSIPYELRDLTAVRQLQPILEALLKRQYKPQARTVAPRIENKTPHWLSAYHVTARVAKIADMILRGHSNASIGLVLDISSETVKVHRRNLYGKMRISSQAELFNQFISHILPAQGAAP